MHPVLGKPKHFSSPLQAFPSATLILRRFRRRRLRARSTDQGWFFPAGWPVLFSHALQVLELPSLSPSLAIQPIAIGRGLSRSARPRKRAKIPSWHSALTLSGSIWIGSVT